MAAPDYSTTGLLAAVRREIFAPDASDQSDADVLAFADDVLASLISATVRKGREGHWLTHEDITIVPGTTSYDVPARALGKAVRGVMVQSPEGIQFALTEIDPLELRAMWSMNQQPAATPAWYAFEDQSLMLGAVPSASGWTLRVFYLRTPPKLIPTSEGSLIEAVASSSELTVTGTPDSTTFADGALFDVVSGIEPYPTLFAGLEVAATSAGGIETSTSPFTFGTPSIPPAQVQNVQPAYAVPANCTVYPPITRSLWPALVRGTGAAMLEATGDDKANAMLAKAEMARKAAVDVMEPRDNRRSMAIIGSSALRSTGTMRRRWW